MSSETLPVAGNDILNEKEDKETAPSKSLQIPDAERGQNASSRTSVSGVDTLVEKAQAGEGEAPPRTVTGFAWALVVLSILSATFLFALDNTVVADVQPAIVERFGAIGKLPWLSVAFLLAVASTNLVWGKIYGQFNAKWLYILTVALFEGGSALCGGAPNMDALIVGRAIAGVGGSGMYVGVLTLLSVTTTIHERPMYIGLTGLTWGLGTVLGPVVGGAFADSSATWRWAFYINLVIGGVFSPIYLFLLPSFDPRPGVPILRRLEEIDFVGTITIIGAFTSGVMALSFGGTTYAWDSGRIIGLFCTSGILFILFGLQQTYAIFTTPERRLFPIQFFKSRTLLICFAMTSAAGTSIFIPVYFIPLLFQFVKEDSALQAAVRLLPLIILLVFCCIFNGAVMSQYGVYMPWYLFGGIFSLIGGALMYTVDAQTSTSRIYGYSVLIGIGAGVYCQASFSVAQGKVPMSDIASAVGFISCAQTSGVTIALAISNTVFLNEAAKKITQILPNTPAETIKGAIAGTGSAFFHSLPENVRQNVLDAIIQAMSKVYILVIVAGALSIVLSLFMKREKLFLAAGGAA